MSLLETLLHKKVYVSLGEFEDGIRMIYIGILDSIDSEYISLMNGKKMLVINKDSIQYIGEGEPEKFQVIKTMGAIE